MENRQSQITPIKFTNQAALVVRLNNILLNKTNTISFALDDKYNVRLQLQATDSNTQNLCPISLTLELGSTSAGLWLSEWPLIEKIDQFVPSGLLAQLPENLSISIIESALAPLIQQAEQALGLKITVQSTSAEYQSPIYNMPLGFEFQVLNQADNSVQQTIFAILMLDPHLYPHLQERLRHWPSDTNADWEEHVTPAWLEISRTVFTMAEINQLQAADLILLEDTRFENESLLRLRLNSGYYCEATLNRTTPSTLTINTEWMPMSDNEQKQNIEHISQIPVQLSFDVGDKTLSFNEVRQLRPGYILELGKSLPEIIQIRSQQRLIGTGELVEINGRVGVRILNLFNKKAKGS
ncbi:type III secretion system cytoplasmic ring protein SctQ [Thiothrix lacustris]|uniref:type III secretion system cytoplasmic ring protein SctQ n=1 Tax=Thiothrix lacustris TaxID=525917 RepID=UPI000687F7F1|nr:type III secretion system cytoplasmic ring protein SctQ [Thiothrix lacustris]